MATTPKLEYTQSPDGKTLTFIDATTYDDPIGNYTRVVELYSSIDGTGTLLATLPFTGTELEVDYAVTVDRYYGVKLSFVGSPSVSPAYLNVTTRQFEINALFNLNSKNCGCVKSGTCDKRFNGFMDMYMSQVATLAGNSALANTSITSSLKWLNS